MVRCQFPWHATNSLQLARRSPNITLQTASIWGVFPKMKMSMAALVQKLEGYTKWAWLIRHDTSSLCRRQWLRISPSAWRGDFRIKCRGATRLFNGSSPRFTDSTCGSRGPVCGLRGRRINQHIPSRRFFLP